VFLTLYFPQSLFVEAEVVGYFVAHYFLYFCFNFIAKTALRLYGPLKDTYLIRQNQSVPPASPSLGHTLVKTKQLGGMTVFNLSQLHHRYCQQVQEYLLSSYHPRLLPDKRITSNGSIKTWLSILVELGVAQ
jgi:hypothetical protein